MIQRIRKGIPDVTFRTTMIVGFPGETEKDFEELLEFCREMEFDRLGVFAYSDEEDTAAFGLEDKVPAEVAEQRRRELMRQQAGIARRKNRQLIGRELPILIEGPSEESNSTPGQAPIPGAGDRRCVPDQRLQRRQAGAGRVQDPAHHPGPGA